MFDIVLGATARRDMAEVQLFVNYLNLHRCIGKERKKVKNKSRKEQMVAQVNEKPEERKSFCHSDQMSEGSHR